MLYFFYIRICKYLGIFNLKTLDPKSLIGFFYVYILFNSSCIFYILYSANNSSNYIYVTILTLLFSLLLYYLDLKGLGWLLNKFYTLWFALIGQKIRDKAYMNIMIINYDLSPKLREEIITDEMIRYETQIKKYPYLPEGKLLKSDIKLMKECLDNCKNENGFNMSATFFSARRPLTYLAEQEYSIQAALSITLLLTYTLTFLWEINIIDFTHNAYQFAVLISILYTTLFFSILHIFIKDYTLEYDDIFYLEYPELYYIFDKYIGKYIEATKIEINKNFFKYYFIFFLYKSLIASLFSSIYFIIVSVIYITFELIIFNNFIGSNILSFWMNYFSLLVFILLLSLIWFSSFIIKSTFITVTINIFFSSIMFGLFMYIFYGDISYLTDHIWNFISVSTLIGVFMSFFVVSTRRMFLDKDNSLIWELEY